MSQILGAIQVQQELANKSEEALAPPPLRAPTKATGAGINIAVLGMYYVRTPHNVVNDFW